MTLKEFLLKETPENGCMLVETSDPLYKYFVAERMGKGKDCSEEILLLNGRYYKNYENAWRRKSWKILYKHNS